MKKLSILLFLGSLALSANLCAHSDEYLDSIPTPHGGQMRMAGMYHFELLVGDDELLIYVTDHADQPVATEQASGTATLLSAGERVQIELQPAGDNRLSGQGKFTPDEAMRVVLSIGFSGQATEQARFTPLAPRVMQETGHTDHGHHH